MTTPNTWRPDGASKHPGWEVIAALLVATASRTADMSTTPAQQEAVRAVNEMLAGLCEEQMLEYARRLNDIAIDVELAQGGLGGSANASDLRRIAQRIVAPPSKPAPDAVREALSVLIIDAKLVYQYREGKGYMTELLYSKLKAAMDRAVTALSAPVPSPDGAAENQTDRQPSTAMTNAQLAMALRNNLSLVGSREKLRELMAAAAARLVANPEQSELIRRCAKITEPWPGFWLDENSSDADQR